MKVHRLITAGVLMMLSLAAGKAPSAQTEKAKKQAEVRKVTAASLQKFYKANPKLKGEVGEAPGYAVFTTYGLSFLVGGEGGKGVAHQQKGQEGHFHGHGAGERRVEGRDLVRTRRSSSSSTPKALAAVHRQGLGGTGGGGDGAGGRGRQVGRRARPLLFDLGGAVLHAHTRTGSRWASRSKGRNSGRTRSSTESSGRRLCRHCRNGEFHASGALADAYAPSSRSIIRFGLRAVSPAEQVEVVEYVVEVVEDAPRR